MTASFNYFAIATAAIANLILGFLWFTLLFKKPYLQDLGKTKQQMDKGPSGPIAATLQLLGNLVMAFVMAWLFQKLGYTNLSQTLPLALMLWLGFIVAIFGPFYAFQAYTFRFFLIIVGGVLIFILFNTFLLTYWK